MRQFRFANRVIDEEPAINLTPLIDVVFVILIMFIVIAPMLELDRIELCDAPTEKHDRSISVQNESPVTIHVYQNNQVRLNNQVVAVEVLRCQLELLKQRHPNARPQLFHDKKALFGTYQNVKNAVESAGFHEMDVILQPSNA